ncbi:MAG: Pr6Pr family membrane protein [Bifidobacterium sp.]|nr:Pr6Pr family membrane protein [Bifidobacterium sp.]
MARVSRRRPVANTSAVRTSTRLAVVWRLAIVISGGFALVRSYRPFSDHPNTGMFRYFTNLSNAAAILYFACALLVMVMPAYRPGRKILWRPLKNMLMMGLLVTMLIAQVLLNGIWTDGKVNPSLLFLHLITPLMMLLDWLFFDAKGAMRSWEPVVWLLWPFAYLVVTLILAPISPIRMENGKYTEYPYGFIDVAALGPVRVAVNVVVLLVLFIILGYIIFGIDHLLKTLLRRGHRA